MTPAQPDDPFDDLVLDEAFIRGARKVEESAQVRAANAERSRVAHEELRRQEALVEAATAAAQRAARRAHRRVRYGRAVGFSLAVVLLAAVVVWSTSQSDDDGGFAFAEGQAAGLAVEEFPTLRPAGRDAPLGTPPEAPARGTTTFVLTDDGEPVTYDPCRPVKFVVNNRTRPPGAEDLVDEALAEVAELTGLALELEGTTDEEPVEERDLFQPSRYGDRWAPVLITWSDRQELPELGGDVVGFGGSAPLELSDQATTYVSGMVALDGPDLEDALDAGHPEWARAVILHELGHLVGLDHVDDRGEVMYPEMQEDVVDFGPGDRRGLAALGAGPCVPLL